MKSRRLTVSLNCALTLALLGMKAGPAESKAQPKPASSHSAASSQLDRIIRDSKVALRYPFIAERTERAKALISTYQPSNSSEYESKSLGFELARAVMSGTSYAVSEVHVRFYNPSDIKQWRDVFVSLADVQAGLSPNMDVVKRYKLAAHG